MTPAFDRLGAEEVRASCGCSLTGAVPQVTAGGRLPPALAGMAETAGVENLRPLLEAFLRPEVTSTSPRARPVDPG